MSASIGLLVCFIGYFKPARAFSLVCTESEGGRRREVDGERKRGVLWFPGLEGEV